MTAVDIIEEIKRLPVEERSKVIEFARKTALTPDELGQLAKRMVEAGSPAEADKLKEEIVQGFYGGGSHA